MAEVTLLPDPRSFPPGTTVKIFPRELPEHPGGRLEGQPPGSVLSEPVVASNGSLTVTGLTEGARYVGWAVVGGTDRYLFFALELIVSSGGGEPTTAIATRKAYIATGIAPQAANQSRWIGQTASGHPTEGTWEVGDWCTDRAGQVWVCTAAGTPGTWAGGAAAGALLAANNLSDLANAGTARTNLGLGSAALKAESFFDLAGAATAAAGAEEARALTAEALKLAKASNLSDVADAATSRLNLRTPIVAACVCVATTNVASLEGLLTIDGVTLEAGQLALLTGQTESKNNGPWVAAAGAWTRPADFATGFELKASRLAVVLKGTVNKLTLWAISTTATITIGTTAHAWERVPALTGAMVEHAFAIHGKLAVEAYEGYTARIEGSEEKSVIGMDLRCEEGTECEVTLRKNGAALGASYEKVVVKKGTPVRVSSTVALADKDYLDLNVLAITGAPGRLSVTVHERQVR